MTRARILIAHASQLCFSIADCFMSAHNRVDSDLAFGLKCSDLRSRFAKLTSKPLGFDFSFSVLTCGSITFAREAFRLLRQTFQRRFELTCNLSESLSDGCLRQKFRSGTFDL